MSDDFIGYIWDSLGWIPSTNPANPDAWGGYGLNSWGPTIIDRKGAPIAKRVFKAWADLLSAAPPEVELRGAWTTWPDGTQDYLVLVGSRDILVEQLRTLEDYAERCSSGNFYILHLGV